MSCKSCKSEHQSNLTSEVAIHFRTQGSGQAHRVGVSKLVVCLDCGFTEFAIPETELRVLRDDAAQGMTA